MQLTGRWVRLLPALSLSLLACAPVGAMPMREDGSPMGVATSPTVVASSTEQAAAQGTVPALAPEALDTPGEVRPTAAATSPAASASPTATPASQAPRSVAPPAPELVQAQFQLQPRVEPSTVPQGGTAMVVVEGNRTVAGIEAQMDGRPVAFDWEGNRGWAFLGFNSQAGAGPHTIALAVTASNGERAAARLTLQVVPARFPVEQIVIPPAPPRPPGTPTVDPLAPSVMATEWNRLLGLTRGITPHRYWTQPFLLPVTGEISSYYGTRRSYNGGPPVEPHQGMDFAGAAGSPVIAANAGIATVGRWDVRGNVVLIDHGIGLWSGYYHLSEVLVSPGQPVQRGQLIGKVGATGLATGPHLHWDMVVQGIHVDPLPWTELAPPT